MTSTPTQSADALIFDPTPSNAAHIRKALYDEGFAKVVLLSNLEEARREFLTHEYDAFVFDATEAASDHRRFIKEVRFGGTSADPLALLVVMTWSRDLAVVRKFVDTGVDDVWNRPMTAHQIGERLHAHIEDRKSFLVTSDYLGPDRRTNRRTPPGNESLFRPANMLRAKLRLDSIAVSAARDERARQIIKVHGERAKRLALRLALDCWLLQEGGAEASVSFEALQRGANDAKRLGKMLNNEALLVAAQELQDDLPLPENAASLSGSDYDELMEKAWLIASQCSETLTREGFLDTVRKTGETISKKLKMKAAS